MLKWTMVLSIFSLASLVCLHLQAGCKMAVTISSIISQQNRGKSKTSLTCALSKESIFFFFAVLQQPPKQTN